MAYHHPHHHHHNHHSSTTSYCYCQQPPPCHHSPPLPTTTPTTSDPFLIATIVTQLLQSQNLQPISKSHNQRDPLHHHHHSPILFSLIERIDAIESSLRSFSYGSRSGSSSLLRDFAARTIQTHFRSYLVRRSRTLGQLQDLGSIKSSLASLKSSLSRHAFVDFDFLSNHAMDLLLKLDSIQSGNKMIKDSKKSVTKEIVEFLDLVDGLCVKKHQVLTRKVKNLRLERNDNRSIRDRDTRVFSEHNVGSKSRNVGTEEKKLIANLRERVEKIGKMTKALEEQGKGEYRDDEFRGFKHIDHDNEDDNIIDQIAGGYRPGNGLNTKKNAQNSNAKKRVCFVEDGNVIKFYDIDGSSRSGSRLVEVIEDANKGSQDEEEVPSDGDGSSNSSENMRKCKNDGNLDEECDNLDEEFTFSNPELAKLDPRAELMSRKSGVKIVG